MRWLWYLLFAALVVGYVVLAHDPAHGAERDYADAWCAAHGGQTEVVLADRTRVDCLTAEHAVEFDFSEKWAESVGQSLHYAQMTGKRAKVVLICGEEDVRRMATLISVIGHHRLPIDVEIMRRVP